MMRFDSESAESYYYVSGAFSKGSTKPDKNSYTGLERVNGITSLFNARRSAATFGSSSTSVQPPSMALLPCIKI